MTKKLYNNEPKKIYATALLNCKKSSTKKNFEGNYRGAISHK